MADLFLSYARADRQSVEPIARQLIFDGWTLWWDPDIVPGAEWADLIQAELSKAKVVLVAWSSISSRSHWVREEADFARRNNKLVAITIDGTDPPLGFGHVQCVDMGRWRFQRESHAYQQLYAGLRHILGSPMYRSVSQRSQSNWWTQTKQC